MKKKKAPFFPATLFVKRDDKYFMAEKDCGSLLGGIHDVSVIATYELVEVRKLTLELNVVKK